MDKEKEIEEIAKVICPNIWTCEVCTIKHGRCTNKLLSERIINAGYGNIKQAVKEFAEKLKSLFCTECDYGGGDIKQTINELIKELYGED